MGRLFILPLLVLIALGLAGGLAVAVAATPLAGHDRLVAHASAGRPVIVDVAGDAANGFTITYSDGSQDFPPTDSESRAECSEYDTMRQRVRCRTEVHTWYRDLADLKRSLAWVRSHR
ncbi:hypothetical protein [Nocardioides sp. GXZ039]|uniref:hypothetical protein n=1 Tax=Nocardioides sp. GXZ039 TaxID=3136018 RepID=UPI0030F38DFF